MSRPLTRFALACVVLAATLLAPQLAVAGDEAPTPGQRDFLAKLDAAERAVLARIPNWAELPAAKRQLIARNLLRMRHMTPEQRLRMQRHIEKMRSKRRGPGRDWRRDTTRALVNRGLGQEARGQLGPDFERRLVERDISARAFEMAFSGIFLGKVAEEIASGGLPAPDTLPDDLPEAHRKRYAEVYARHAKAEPKAKARMARRLGFMLAFARIEQFRSTLARGDHPTGAYAATVGARMRERWPEAFAASVGDADALLRAAERVEVKRGLNRLIRRSGRLDKDESALLLRMLERYAAQAGPDAAVGEDADALVRHVLRTMFDVPADVVDRLPPHGDAEARAQFIRRYLQRHGLRVRDGGRPPRRGGRAVPGMVKKPAGVSTDGWTRIREAMREARKGGRFADFATGERPDGVSEADWAAFGRAAEAAWKRVEGRRGR